MVSPYFRLTSKHPSDDFDKKDFGVDATKFLFLFLMPHRLGAPVGCDLLTGAGMPRP